MSGILTCTKCGTQRPPQEGEFTDSQSQSRNAFCVHEKCRTMRLHLVGMEEHKPVELELNRKRRPRS